MANNTIGQFISALRRANGMTQQEVADRLNVSNKAVSRWERDECAPDISVIPAIAEMFGISCDELLKGERIINGEKERKNEPKIEKQIRYFINKGVSRFKTFIYISLALSAIGFVCMLGIAFGAYRPRIGFAVMMLFEISAFCITLIGLGKFKEISFDNELFDGADEDIKNRYFKVLADMSYTAFASVISSIALSVPFLLVYSSFIFSVISFDSYCSWAAVIAMSLVSLFIYFKGLYTSYITGKGYIKETVPFKVKLMNILQLSFLSVSALLVLIAPYTVRFSKYGSLEDVSYTPYSILGWSAIFLLLGIIICFVIFTVRCREERKTVLFYGIRNILFIPSVLWLTELHSVSFILNASIVKKQDIWFQEYFFYALGWSVIVITVFSIIKSVKRKV